MRLHARSAMLGRLAAGLATAAELPSFAVLSGDAGAWPEICLRSGSRRDPLRQPGSWWPAAARPFRPSGQGAWSAAPFLILEGESPLAEMFGFRPGKESARVTSLTDVAPSQAAHHLGEGAGVAGV